MPADQIAIKTCGPLNASIRPPGSKSITNRALICAALARGSSLLSGVLESEDTQVMVKSLQDLGLQLDWDRSRGSLEIAGCGGAFPAPDCRLYVANSGTTMRFLTAALAAGNGSYLLDGVPRMRERPIQDLLDALNALGANAQSQQGNRCPPVRIDACQLSGGNVTIRGDISSQFLSGLLMATPYALNPVQLDVTGQLVSQPYVTMTLAVMREFGVTVSDNQLRSFRIEAPQHYVGRSYNIEPDASAASYFWAAAAITGGQVTVEGLGPDALQGDVRFCDCLEQMGCVVDRSADSITVVGRPLHGIDVDMNSISDTAQTLAAVALFADGPTTIRGIAHNRHKETDRIADLARELRKLGAEADERDDGLRIEARKLQGASIATYHDHRMAMSLALVGLRVPNVIIEDPRCTEKTYPHFFADLDALRTE